jgi:hypothetical protein
VGAVPRHGKIEIVGGRPNKNAVVLRLSDFVIPLQGFALLQGYYLEEYGRLGGLEISSSVIRSTANHDACCEWELCLGRSPQTEAYVASLPAT